MGYWIKLSDDDDGDRQQNVNNNKLKSNDNKENNASKLRRNSQITKLRSSYSLI